MSFAGDFDNTISQSKSQCFFFSILKGYSCKERIMIREWHIAI